MRPNPCVLVFVFYAASCGCGVINEGPLAKQHQDREKRMTLAIGEEPKYEGLDTPERYCDPDSATEQHEIPSIKRKRCPSLQQTHNSYTNAIVGAMTPSGIQRRDLQYDVLKRLCDTCLTRPQCKTYKKCDQCKRWCVENDPSPNEITNEPPKNETEHVPNEIISFPNRFGDLSEEDTRVSLPPPGDVKTIFTIANFSSGAMKELILHLLGIPDPRDIDKMVIWVTTFSNESPNFATEYNKNVSPLVEKMTEVMNDELKRMLEEKKKQGRNYLTNAEMETLAKKILVEYPPEPNVGQSSGTQSSSSEDSSNFDFGTDGKVNPDLREDEDMVPPKLPEGSNEKFAAPRFSSRGELREAMTEDGRVGTSKAEKEDIEAAGEEDSSLGRSNLQEADKPLEDGLDSMNDKAVSTTLEDEANTQSVDKNEPSKLLAKNLLQQVRDKMEQVKEEMGQRLRNPQQYFPGIRGSKDSNLKNTEDQTTSEDSPLGISNLPQLPEAGKLLRDKLDSKNEATLTTTLEDENHEKNKNEPSRLLTKNLLQQVKDKMEERWRRPQQNFLDIDNPKQSNLGKNIEDQDEIISEDSNLGRSNLPEAGKPLEDKLDSKNEATLSTTLEDEDHDKNKKEPSRFLTKNLLQQVKDKMEERWKRPQQNFLDIDNPKQSNLGKNIEDQDEIISEDSNLGRSNLPEAGKPLEDKLDSKNEATLTTTLEDEDHDKNKKEPSRFLTKNLLQQVKDKMEERWKQSQQNFLDIDNPKQSNLGKNIEDQDEIISEDSNLGRSNLPEAGKTLEDKLDSKNEATLTTTLEDEDHDKNKNKPSRLLTKNLLQQVKDKMEEKWKQSQQNFLDIDNPNQSNLGKNIEDQDKIISEDSNLGRSNLLEAGKPLEDKLDSKNEATLTTTLEDEDHDKNKNKPSRLLTKNLLQQVKDKMEERWRRPQQNFLDIDNPKQSNLGKNIEDQDEIISEDSNLGRSNLLEAGKPLEDKLDSKNEATLTTTLEDEDHDKNKNEPSRLLTKNLLQQVKDKMEERWRRPQQNFLDIDNPKQSNLGKNIEDQDKIISEDSNLGRSNLPDAGEALEDRLEPKNGATLSKTLEDEDHGKSKNEPSRFITKNLLQQVKDKMEEKLRNPQQHFLDIGNPKQSNLGDIEDRDQAISEDSNLERSNLLQTGEALEDRLDTKNEATATITLEDENFTEPTIDKNEPPQFVTKKLMKQIKDKMEQRLRYPNQYLSDIQDPNDSNLGSIDDQNISKVGDSEKSETTDSTLQSSETPEEDPQSNTIDTIVVEKPRDQNIIDANQGMQMKKDSTVGVSDPQVGSMSENIKSRLGQTSPFFNKLKDNSQNIFETLKKTTPDAQKITNFDTAKAVLKDVEHMVEQIQKKTTDIRQDNEKGYDAMLGMNNDGKNSLTTAQNLENTAGDLRLRPTEPLGSTLEKEETEHIQKITNGSQSMKFYDKEKLGLPKSQILDEESDKLGSQPIENVIWDKHAHPHTSQSANQKKYKDKMKLGSSMTENPQAFPPHVPAEFPAQKISIHGKELPLKQKTKIEVSPHAGPDEVVRQTWLHPNENLLQNEPLSSSETADTDEENNTGTDAEPAMDENRNIPERIISRFNNIDDSSVRSSQLGNALHQNSWSNSLGALVPLRNDQSLPPLVPKDMYFIGNGIKLPLQMVRNRDGAVHLSVDLDKLCSCKNNTVCPKNHTEGTILGDQGSNTANDFGSMVVGMSSPNHQDPGRYNLMAQRNGRGTGSTWLDMKNSIASQLDPYEEYAQREESSLFKRSTEKNENAPEKITIGENDLEATEITEEKGNRDNLDTFQQFLNEKLTNLKSKMKDIDQVKSQQPEDMLMNALNAINKNTKLVSKGIEDKSIYGGIQKSLNELEALDHSPKSFLESRLKEDLSKEQREAELFDMVTPIKGVYKFKKAENLQNKLEKINESINRYSKENEDLLKKEATMLLKTQKDSFIKKEVDIINSVLKFLKAVATDK